MAEIIPPLNRQTLSHMTSGEKRLARRLESLLEDDYLVWYDIPVGKKRRYPDFIILHPSRGLLFLEVKDWTGATLRKISKTDVTLETNNGQVTCPHPLEQARQYTYAVIDMLQRDSRLINHAGPYMGKMIMPYGWGVVFTNITRKQITKAIPEDGREILLPDHLMIYKDEMTESLDPEAFQEQLWGMFNYQFDTALTLPQIDRIRWHLFPEIRIDDHGQTDMFMESNEEEPSIEESLPGIVKILDIQQEQLARSLGDGHRVVHGVSGSGKTLILGYRCLYLAQALKKPILVLCFNITLAARLRAFITSKGITGQVQVYHFHDWCGQQLKMYHVDVINADKQYWERQVDSVITGVESGAIPRAQYGALLIDEGHDFKSEWLQLVVQMIDSENNSLLLLYDDAQSIYKKSSGLGFTLSSVGIQAQGRTTILRLNYRNTREILDFSYSFASHYLDPHSADDDHIPLIEPEAAGTSGPEPVFREFEDINHEVEYTVKCLNKWHEHGVPWGDMAVLYIRNYQGKILADRLKIDNIPNSWLGTKEKKKSYNSDEDKVTLVTVQSSKGLEFSRVIILGIGQLDDREKEISQGSRLLYVGMTRARECLLMMASKKNEYSRLLFNVASGNKDK